MSDTHSEIRSHFTLTIVLMVGFLRQLGDFERVGDEPHWPMAELSLLTVAVVGHRWAIWLGEGGTVRVGDKDSQPRSLYNDACAC